MKFDISRHQRWVTTEYCLALEGWSLKELERWASIHGWWFLECYNVCRILMSRHFPVYIPQYLSNVTYFQLCPVLCSGCWQCSTHECVSSPHLKWLPVIGGPSTGLSECPLCISLLLASPVVSVSASGGMFWSVHYNCLCGWPEKSSNCHWGPFSIVAISAARWAEEHTRNEYMCWVAEGHAVLFCK